MQSLKQIGIVLEELSASQLSYYAVNEINRYSEDSDLDFVMFFENSTPSIVQPQFATMAVNELWAFNGVGISTSVSTALSLLKSHSVKKKYFYVWDLEWTMQSGRDYDYNIKAFINPELELIARSKDHALAIENYCNRPVKHVVSNFNMKKLMEVIYE